MWKEILETKVIRIEGSDQSDLTTLVYLTDTLAEELNPYNKDKAFEIPLKTTCRVEIKSSVTGLSKSVSFNSKIFEEAADLAIESLERLLVKRKEKLRPHS